MDLGDGVVAATDEVGACEKKVTEVEWVENYRDGLRGMHPLSFQVKPFA